MILTHHRYDIDLSPWLLELVAGFDGFYNVANASDDTGCRQCRPRVSVGASICRLASASVP